MIVLFSFDGARFVVFYGPYQELLVSPFWFSEPDSVLCIGMILPYLLQLGLYATSADCAFIG